MKFYKEKNNTMYWCEIIIFKLNAIYCNDFAIRFYKNGEHNNTKNAAFIRRDGFKIFNLNDNFMVIKIILLNFLGANLLNCKLSYEIL